MAKTAPQYRSPGETYTRTNNTKEEIEEVMTPDKRKKLLKWRNTTFKIRRQFYDQIKIAAAKNDRHMSYILDDILEAYFIDKIPDVENTNE